MPRSPFSPLRQVMLEIDFLKSYSIDKNRLDHKCNYHDEVSERFATIQWHSFFLLDIIPIKINHHLTPLFARLTLESGDNVLSLVMRDGGIMRFVKYVSAAAPGDQKIHLFMVIYLN